MATTKVWPVESPKRWARRAKNYRTKGLYQEQQANRLADSEPKIQALEQAAHKFFHAGQWAEVCDCHHLAKRYFRRAAKLQERVIEIRGRLWAVEDKIGGYPVLARFGYVEELACDVVLVEIPAFSPSLSYSSQSVKKLVVGDTTKDGIEGMWTFWANGGRVSTKIDGTRTSEVSWIKRLTKEGV